VTAPSYFLLHLLTTSASGTGSAPTAQGISVAPAFAASIPLALTFGYVLPTMALMLPAPSVVSYDTHQMISAAWQVFPIYIAVLQIVTQETLRALFPSMRVALEASRSKAALRAAYIYGIACAAWGHIGVTSLWMMHGLIPSLFARSFPSLSACFVPKAFWLRDARRIKKGEAATLLLQWDEVCGSLATFVWASALLWGGMSKTKRTSGLSVVAAVMACLAAVGLLGPCGAAVAMIWARDEMVWNVVETEKVDEDRKSQ
jgi:hypothetical protein